MLHCLANRKVLGEPRLRARRVGRDETDNAELFFWAEYSRFEHTTLNCCRPQNSLTGSACAFPAPALDRVAVASTTMLYGLLLRLPGPSGPSCL